VATAFSYGSKHDFQVFKDDACRFSEHLRILADAGYQGLMELHENSQAPFKKSKYHILTKQEKRDGSNERTATHFNVAQGWGGVVRADGEYFG